MKKTKIYLHSLLLLLVCCFVLCTTAFAASGFLRVVIVDENKDFVQDFNVEICLVASYDGTSYALTDEFSQLGISADELAEDLSQQKSEQVFGYVLDRNITGQVLTTNEEGAVDFTDIDYGVYLVFERGGHELCFSPYLISVPTQTEPPQYSVYSVPKTLKGETRDITVEKIWDDNEDAENMRPEILNVTLYRDGNAVRTIVLSEENGWQHTFYKLPGGEYTVTEDNLVDYNGTCAESEGKFTLTNTYSPPETPSEPELPQTGFKMWPVYVLLVAGSVLIILGLADICIKREEQ